MVAPNASRWFRETARLFALIGASALLSLFPRVAQAGLYTGPLNPNDITAGSAWANPAAMMNIEDLTALAGLGGVFPIARYDAVSEAGGSSGTNAGVGTVLPTAYLVTPLSEQFAVGLSIFAPLGGPNGVGWEFPDEWAGRYGALETTLASISIAPSVAWRATDEWSLGGGVAFQWVELNLSTAINTPFEGDGKNDLQNLSSWSARYFIGTRYQFSPTTSLGVVYRSKWDVALKGKQVISGLPIDLPANNFQFDATLPQQVEFGVQHAFSPTWILDVTADWEDWTQFNNWVLGVEFRGDEDDPLIGTITSNPNWQDTYSFGASITHVHGTNNFIEFGGIYGSSPVSDENRFLAIPADKSLTLSAGFAHATPAAMYSIGGAVLFNGDAPVSGVLQGFDFSGSFGTNIAYVFAGGIQW